MNKISSIKTILPGSFHAPEIDKRPDILLQRIHDPHQYIFRCTKEELLEKLKKANEHLKTIDDDLLKYLADSHSAFDEFKAKIKIIESKVASIELMIMLCMVNIHTSQAKCTEEEMASWVLESLDAHVIEQNKFTTLEEIKHKFGEVCSHSPHVNKNNEVDDLLYGRREICLPAVFCVLNSFQKVAMKIEIAIAQVNNHNSEANLKNFLLHCMKLSQFFDAIYAASLDNPDDIFYNDMSTDELTDFFKHYESHVPENITEHCEKLKNTENELDFILAIASQGMWNESLVSQAFNIATYGVYYYFNHEKAKDQAKFFMGMLKEDAMHRILQIPQTSLVKRQIHKSLDPVKIDKKVDIPIHKADEITLENISDTSLPEMVVQSLELHYEFERKSYNANDHVRMRLISNFEWNSINWKNGSIVQDSEVAHVEAVIMYVHGGGYVCGSSASSRPVAYHFAQQTGFPVFSVDYRLTTTNKFPTQISDVWQAYLWITNYSEKYLRLKFDKIILVGDSAGGNLCCAISTLCIQKDVQKPDGLNLIYPSLVTEFSHFSPSMLLALDDPILSGSFMLFALKSYIDPEDITDSNKNFLSPLNLPAEILKEYPPVRIQIAGLDPLRDDCIRFVKRCVEAQVEIYAHEFSYLMHCFVEHGSPPYDQEEAKLAMKIAAESVTQLVKNN